MRQRVTLQTLVETADSFGQKIESWTDTLTTWAEILTIGGGEQVVGEQVQAVSTHTVKIRWRRSVTILETMRLAYAGRVFAIVQAKDVDFRHREARLMCRELVGVSPNA